MKLPVLKPKQLIRVLEKMGFVEKRQTGSHRIFYCSQEQIIIPVPIHSRDLKRGLVHSIIRELNLSTNEFIYLLKQ